MKNDIRRIYSDISDHKSLKGREYDYGNMGKIWTLLLLYSKLNSLKDHVNIAEAMSGEQGAERVKKYSVPMAAGLAYNYAAKEVDETVLDALSKLADEAELIEKFPGII